MSAKKVSLIQKLMVFMLVGIFSVCLLTASASAPDITGNSGEDRVYSDLSRSNPYFNYIKYLSQRGIVAGFPDGSFKPEESVSRAEAAVMLAKAMGLEAGPAGETGFHDVGKNHWAAAYIESCAKAGYMKGYPDGSFHPDEILSRAQGISLVLGLSRQDMSQASLPQIEDVSPEHWAARYIATGLAAGMAELHWDIRYITTGPAADMVELESSGKKFLPDSPFSRQDMCRALAMLLTQDPDLYACELKGALAVESGEIILTRAGQRRKIEKNEVLVKGDAIESGPGGRAVIYYPDGSSVLIKENSVLSITDSRGRNYIVKDGSPGVAVDWLDIQMDKGVAFFALATAAAEPARDQAEENNTAASTQSVPPWYEAAQQKKVKIKVDMPYGAVAVRGTIIMISVASDGRCSVSCLKGNAEVGGGDGTQGLTDGLSSMIDDHGASPSPPESMTSQQQQQFQNEQDWMNNIGQYAGDKSSGFLISSINNITADVIAGQRYQLPDTVEAVMTDGTRQQVGVTWNVDHADTSQAGTVIIYGTVTGYSGTVKLTITVVSINSIDNIKQRIKVGQRYSLPTQATASMSDGSKRQVPVTWSPSTASTAAAGSFIFTGKVEGYAPEVQLILTVAAPPPRISSISNIEVEKNVGESYNLPAQVEATMSDGSKRQVPVTWSPSTASTAAAGSFTFVGKVEGYAPEVQLILTVAAPPPRISSISNIEVEKNVGESYNLPAQVKATMSDGSKRQVPVTWDPSTASTAAAGNFTFTGKVEGYAPEVQLTLTVVDPPPHISLISNIEVEKNVGESYNLPAQIEATMSDGSKRQVPVTWDPSTASTAAAGSFTFTGKVEGYAPEIYLTLTVVAPPPHISLISNIEVEKNVGESYNLPAQVEATMSDGSKRQVPVTWDPSTASTAAAGSFTFTGRVEGYAPEIYLTLTVVAPPPHISLISNIEVEKNVGESYNLPAQVEATMSDGSKRQVPVTWDPSTASTAAAGNFTFTGKVEGYAPEVQLTLTVVAPPPHISLISNIEVEKNVGESYNLPAQVEATMSDGSKRQVPVTWDPSTASTAAAGSFTFTGRVEGYAPEIYLTLTVVAPPPHISLISNIEVEKNVGESYNLPAQVEATMSDGSKRQVPVTWDPSTASTAAAGSFTFTGKVEGYAPEVQLILTVVDSPPRINSISNIEVEKNVGESYNLPAQVEATMSDDSKRQVPVTWDPSTASTAAAGSFTFTGKVEGYAPEVYLTLTVVAPPPHISLISNIEVEKNVGESYSLPAQVEATMSDGSKRQVPVTWDPSTASTAAAGSFTFTGKVEGYAPEVYLTLTVAIPPPGISSISNIEVEKNVGESYNLPAQVEATMSDGSKRQVPVTWDPSTASTAAAGSFTFTGKVEGYAPEVQLILTVVAPPPIISSISNIEVEKNVGESYSLPAQVEATMSDDSKRQVPVTWDPSTASTTAAGSFTFVGKVEGYAPEVYLTLTVAVPPPIISSISNIEVEKNVGESYSLPAQVEATMSDDSKRQVPVTWDPSTASTAAAGNFTFNGRVEGYAPEVQLTLTVVAPPPHISLISNIEVEKNVGEGYNLPAQVEATMSDGSKRQVPVTWSPSTASTAAAGNFTFAGKVEGYAPEIQLILTVAVPPPGISLISNIEVEKNVGESYNLPAQIEATMSDGSKRQVPVTWSPSTASTAAAGSFTFTGKVEGYAPEIQLILTVVDSPPRISSISNIEHEINVGDDFIPPSHIWADMSDGSALQVAITWSPSTVDTAVAGIYNFTGRVAGYTPDVYLTLTVVKSISSIANIECTMNVGEPYSLPIQVTATMSDGSKRQVPVTWDPSTASTAAAGSFTFVGKVEGYVPEVQLILTVVDPPPHISLISNIEVEKNVDESYNLPAQIEATMSDGSKRQVPVTWDPPTASTAAAGSFTFIGKVEGYATEIQLTLTVAAPPPHISLISNIEVEKNVGESYSLPAQVEATMSDGSKQQVPVTWDPATASTAAAGSFTFVGKVEGYVPEVQLILTIVTPPPIISSISNIEVEKNVGESYSLPAQVEATMSDGSKQQVPVTWDPPTASTAAAGNFTFIGNVEGYATEMQLTLTVKPLPQLALPTANPPGGNFDVLPKSIILSCTEEGAAIYYTDDGSDPKNSGTQKTYSGSIELPAPDPDQSPRTVTIKAYATKEGMADSEVATFTYGENR